MAGFTSKHYLAVGIAVVVIVLLLFAPHHSGDVVVSAEELAATEGEPPSVENQIDSALQIIQGEAPMQGILLLRQIAEENPSNFRAQYQLGVFSAQTAQWEKVIERFEALQKIDPDFAESNYWLGLAKMNLGRPVQAKAHFEAFLEMEENNQELINEARKMLNQIPN